MIEEVKNIIRARFSGVLLFIIIFALGLAVFVAIPIILGSVFLYVWEYCLCMTANWSWFSRWVYGIFAFGLPISFSMFRIMLKRD